MIGRLLWVLVTCALVMGSCWLHSVDSRLARFVCAVIDGLGAVMFVALVAVVLWIGFIH